MTIDPGFLDQLDRFAGSIDRQVDALARGQQRSHRAGEGLTFRDHRKYVPGDDVRLLDWNLFARSDELYIKEFESERELTVHVLLDASASMDFGAEGGHKFEYAAKLGLGFAYLAAAENNEFRFTVFGEGESLDRLDGSASNRGEILRVLELLNERTPHGETDIRAVLEAYAGTIDTRSLVVVASDFLAEPDDIGAGVAALERNDVRLAHVVAPEERDLPTQGDTIFEGLEADASLRTYYGGRLEQTYKERLEAHIATVAERTRGPRTDHVPIDTGTDFFESFADLWVR